MKIGWLNIQILSNKNKVGNISDIEWNFLINQYHDKNSSILFMLSISCYFFWVTVLLSTFYSNFVNFWVDSCYGQLSMIYYSHIGNLSIDLKLKRIIVNYIESCMVKLSMKISVLKLYKKIVNDLLQPYNQIVNFNINFSYELKPYKTTVNDFFAITAVLSICKLLNLDLSLPNLT